MPELPTSLNHDDTIPDFADKINAFMKNGQDHVNLHCMSTPRSYTREMQPGFTVDLPVLDGGVSGQSTLRWFPSGYFSPRMH